MEHCSYQCEETLRRNDDILLLSVRVMLPDPYCEENTDFLGSDTKRKSVFLHAPTYLLDSNTLQTFVASIVRSPISPCLYDALAPDVRT